MKEFDILEEYNVVTDSEKDLIDECLLSMKWERGYGTTPRYPSYFHTLYARNDQNMEVTVSPWAEFFRGIIDRTIEKYNLAPNGYSILRAALNDGLNYSDPHGDIHLDYPFPNYLLLLYLTTSSGGTNIYTYTREDPLQPLHTEGLVLRNSDLEEGVWHLPLKRHIKCEEYKIGAFNGKYWHTACPRKEQERRVVCVFSISPNEEV
jgi:hypothetical protein